MAFNILSGSIANYNLEASGSFSGSFAGDGADLINVEQFKTQNQGDKRVLFYKLNAGDFELNANSNFKFNPSTEVLTIPETTASTLNVINDFTVDTNAFHVDSANNRIGVGTVTPTSIAGVSTFIELSDASSAGIVMHDTGGTEWAIYSADSSLIITANATRRMTLLENGKVGIGTTNPDALLDLKGDGTAGNEVLRLSLDGDRDWSFAQEGSGAGTGLRLRSLAAKDFYIDATAIIYRNHDGSGEIMRIEPANQKVGIGTATPSAKLDIVGDLKVSTALTASTAKLTGLSAQTAVATKYLALDSNNNVVLTSSSGTGGGGGGGGGDISYSRRFITAHATASNSDTLIGISASAPLELRLASAGDYTEGQYFTVKDEAGNSNLFNITIITSGSQTIDGFASIILESPFSAVNIYSNGTDKFFIY